MLDPREAEVEDLDPPVGGEEDVLGLEVAVHDPGVVGGGEAVGDLGGDLDRLRAPGGARARAARRSVSPSRSSVTA